MREPMVAAAAPDASSRAARRAPAGRAGTRRALSFELGFDFDLALRLERPTVPAPAPTAIAILGAGFFVFFFCGLLFMATTHSSVELMVAATRDHPGASSAPMR